jgi:hypothetical protein
MADGAGDADRPDFAALFQKALDAHDRVQLERATVVAGSSRSTCFVSAVARVGEGGHPYRP